MLTAACPLLKVKRGSSLSKKKQDVWPSIFSTSEIWDTDWLWASKTNENDDSFAPFKPSFYRNTICKEK